MKRGNDEEAMDSLRKRETAREELRLTALR